MTSRQIITKLIKAIKNNDKTEINKLRKEYSKTGYVISDYKLKQMMKKYSSAKSKIKKSRKSKSSKRNKLRKSKSRKSRVRKSKIKGGMLKRISGMIYGDNSLPKAEPPKSSRKKVYDKDIEDDFVDVSIETEDQKVRNKMIFEIKKKLNEIFKEKIKGTDKKSYEDRNNIVDLMFSLEQMKDEDIIKYHKKFVLDLDKYS